MDTVATEVITIAQIIQLALTPIFLLSGVGIILTVLTNRLARIVDRARRVEEGSPEPNPGTPHPRHQELETLAYRARLINRAITLSTICALLVAMVVATLFLNEFIPFSLSTTIAVMFVLAMFSLIAALLLFLREVYMSIRALRFGISG